jgi:hypothetical protein
MSFAGVSQIEFLLLTDTVEKPEKCKNPNIRARCVVIETRLVATVKRQRMPRVEKQIGSIVFALYIIDVLLELPRPAQNELGQP